MPERYANAILRYLAKRGGAGLTPDQIAHHLGVAEADSGTFREAVKLLRDSGQVILGTKDAMMLPKVSSRVVGVYRANPRGFGFVIPDTPNDHGDLFIPPGAARDAMTGDHVAAAVRRHGKREKKMVCEGEIVEVLRRGKNRFVGTLENAKQSWFVVPDGKGMVTPIVVADVGAAGPKPGTKVIVEIVRYPAPGELPEGVIVEALGEAGPIEIETLSIIRAHGFSEQFSDTALNDARGSIEAFDPENVPDSTDLTAETIVTIDPPDARDFDDAISLKDNDGGVQTLGVHIADVSYFVLEGTQLDIEARDRGTSVYFPRKVLPMLPPILSNGVCSLQEGKRRLCKTVFITYDENAQVLATHFAESVIASAKRLTYEQAQGICDGKIGGCTPEVAGLLRRMEQLARKIEARRQAAGAIELELPEVQLVFDEDGKVVDAVPEDHAYSHKIIEMFMVEANEAVAGLLDRLDRPFLRRIHPAPDDTSNEQLATFVRACGHKLPRDMTRHDIQAMLRAVKGRPESYAVSLAVLKMFEQAEYSPMRIGHYALASKNYCHFTSPIRRYPDLTVHRLIAEHCRGMLVHRPPEDVPALVKLGATCSATERQAEQAEDELRTVLLLQHLEGKVGETFCGVITGVTNFGVFVQSPRYLIDGLIRIEHLGDDWWEIEPRHGLIRGERTGKTYRIGDTLDVLIASVDVARRTLDLQAVRAPGEKKPAAGKRMKPAAPRGKKMGKHRTKPFKVRTQKTRKQKPGKRG